MFPRAAREGHLRMGWPWRAARGRDSRATAWVAQRCRPCKVVQHSHQRGGVAVAEASVETRRCAGVRRRGRDRASPGPRQRRLLPLRPRSRASHARVCWRVRASAELQKEAAVAASGTSIWNAVPGGLGSGRGDAGCALESPGGRARSGSGGANGRGSVLGCWWLFPGDVWDAEGPRERPVLGRARAVGWRLTIVGGLSESALQIRGNEFGNPGH